MGAPTLRLGLVPWLLATNWAEVLDFAQRADRLGYEHLWLWDHLYAIFGDSNQPIYEGWTSLAALAASTRRVRLGLLVAANTFRNPGVVAKMATTVDHISGGRAILGVGGAWFELEHRAYGIDFGRSAGERLDWLDEAVGIMRALLEGETVSRRGGHYHFEALRQVPRPLQRHLPLMIGGSGTRKTLRTVARYADMWNGQGTPDDMRHKDEVLRRHCAEVGRDESAIERTLGCKLVIRDSQADAERVRREQMAYNRLTVPLWVGNAEYIAEQILAYRAIGIHTVIVEMPAPFDVETIERLMGEVKPIVDAA